MEARIYEYRVPPCDSSVSSLTSTVVILMPAGFHLGRFHPSTHIAPRLSKLTVPSPSPILTPLRTLLQVRQTKERDRKVTFGVTVSFVYAASIQLDINDGRPTRVSKQPDVSLHSVASVSVSSDLNAPWVYLSGQSPQSAHLLYFGFEK